MSAASWEERYRASARVFSGRPNDVLVAEAGQLSPGRALDVGCGEGGDAIWLAQHGWHVLGIDVSQTALERAEAAADATGLGDRTTWSRRDTPQGIGAFDLVTAHYLPLPVEAGDAGVRDVLDCVGPGGTLLFVGHAPEDISERHAREFHQPAGVAEFLDEGWRIVVNETRERTTPAPEGTHHRHHTVLRAERRRL